MVNRNILFCIVVIAILTLSAAGAWAGEMREDEKETEEEGGVGMVLAASAVAPNMNYQGRLLDNNGDPVTGPVSMRFRLYDEPVGGILVWGPQTKSVTVTDGLFNTELSNLDVEDFDQALWLDIKVDSALLSPRQQLMCAPYAFSLVPGAEMLGSLTKPLLTVDNTNWHGIEGLSYNGDGVRGISYGGNAADHGVYGETDSTSSADAGVYGKSTSNAAGGRFRSDEGDGVRAYSYGSGSYDDGVSAYSTNGRGVYAYSANSHGVYGEADGSGDYGGYFDGYNGVYGNGYYGVYGNGSYGVIGHGGNYEGGYFWSDEDDGVYAYSSGSGDGDSGVYARSDEGDGVYARSYGSDSYDDGVYAYSTNGRGVYGGSTNSHGVYGDGGSGSGDYGGYFDGYNGVYGNGYYGVYGNGYWGVYGNGSSYGLYARTYGDDGVWAVSYGPGTSNDGVYARSSNGRGVYGSSANYIGVQGRGGSGSGDYGGYFTSSGYRGLYAKGASGWNAAYFDGNIYVDGSIYKSGSCFFVEDHPTNSTKEIVYVCLEGGETGTYTRGSAQLKNGVATVELPEDFRLVTGSEGITVQVTPTANCEGLYVAEKSNSTIVIKELGDGKSDATFDYLVNGIRIGYEDYQPIQDKDLEHRDPGLAVEHVQEKEPMPPEPSPVREPIEEEREEPVVKGPKEHVDEEPVVRAPRGPAPEPVPEEPARE